MSGLRDGQNALRSFSWLERRPRMPALQVQALAIACVLLGGSPVLSQQPSPETKVENAPPTVVSGNDLLDELPIDQYDRDHWAYHPVKMPPVPEVQDSSWPKTTIDHFILHRLETEGLRPAPRADRETLLRRVTFDLTGLPPTQQQINDFIGDRRPGAYRRMVDRTLSSPQFGHRWGQFWLDLARFAETDGFEHDHIRPTAWKYRDWVIQSLNRDLPYDRFVSMQLAGDVLWPEDADAVAATAFCLAGPDMPDINSQQERKHVLMNEITSTVASVLMSLQIGCAQCHDHKYDAISQADFYRLRAFFDAAVKPKRNESLTVLGANPDLDAITRVYLRGDWRRPGPVIEAAFPRIANPDQRPVVADDPTRKRAELADWLVNAENPLTSRSIVNRLWQFHFGKGFSSTPSDFGLMGADPTHPDLLDYLAANFVRNQWSLKRLHREIVLSSVYQTRSHLTTDSTASGQTAREDWLRSLRIDPTNEQLSRFPRRRLDAEAIRDAMLAASDSLNHEQGGPGVRPPLPPELIKTLKKGQWKNSPREADHYRRSIYIFARRNLRYPLFATFDRPAANCSCAVRHPSTTAVQSLLLLNSELSLNAAEKLARAVDIGPEGLDARCDRLYQRTISRSPTAEERQFCLDFLHDQIERLKREGEAEPMLAALTDLSLALFNSNQFLYVD